MARTFIRQDTQIFSSDVYNDAVAPSLANYETNPLNVEEDFNNLRSMVSHLLDLQVGNWYDVVNTPTTLETGIQRGVSDLNTGLHAVEKKRILRDVHSLVDITVTAGVAATGTLTNATNFLDTETVTIDGKVYTFQTVLTNVDGNVQIGATVALSHENLRRSINLDGVAGTNYAALMTLHSTVSAIDTATTTVVTAKLQGTTGNAITTIQATATGSWSAATLVGGAGDVVILGTGELPVQTTAAVGAVTTLGTVVAAHGGAFGNHALTEVVGVNALNPKNLVAIFDGATRDPILSASRTIWGLIQGESGVTDGTTITDTTTTRVQVSFVRINATGDDLEACPAADIQTKVVNYCTRERVRLEDLTEEDFLKGAVIDTPGASTVDRQTSYNNQGVTPVNVITNSLLDLQGPGLAWQIRDDLQAILMQVIEGSAGGTSSIQVAAGVDTFDVNAVVNDFAAGARFDTGGQRINIGEIAGTIESTGANDLRVLGALELFLDDSNQTGSTWAQTNGIKLSETTAEWNAFEVEFGEISILNAIVAASNNSNRTRGQAVVQTNVVANTDIALTTAGNLDVDLPDYSGVTFITDVDVFLNGNLLRNGVNAAANEDVYPGTTPAVGMLKFEFPVKGTGAKKDVITMVVYGQ